MRVYIFCATQAEYQRYIRKNKPRGIVRRVTKAQDVLGARPSDTFVCLFDMPYQATLYYGDKEYMGLINNLKFTGVKVRGL